MPRQAVGEYVKPMGVREHPTTCAPRPAIALSISPCSEVDHTWSGKDAVYT